MVEGKPIKNFFRAMLYLSPALIFLAIFTFYPLFNTFIISFREKYEYMQGIHQGIGFENYKALLKASYFGPALLNTMIIVFVSVPLSLILSLLISVALNSIKSFKKILQTVFFLPYVTNTIAIGMVFAVMFESKQGLVNAFIKMCGSEGINWLGAPKLGTGSNLVLLFEWFDINKIADAATVFEQNLIQTIGNTGIMSVEKLTSLSEYVGISVLFDKIDFITPQYLTALTVLMVYIIWNSLPFKILILLSSLQSIDKQYYQAAKIDGASKIKTFMNITVPFVSPQLVYLMITSFIGAWKEYSAIDAIFGTGGGINGKDNMATVVWHIYRFINSSMSGQMGYAAAFAVILFVIILLFTALNRYISNKKVHY